MIQSFWDSLEVKYCCLNSEGRGLHAKLRVPRHHPKLVFFSSFVNFEKRTIFAHKDKVDEQDQMDFCSLFVMLKKALKKKSSI